MNQDHDEAPASLRRRKTEPQKTTTLRIAHTDIRTTMKYGDSVTDEMEQAHKKVVGLAMNGSQNGFQRSYLVDKMVSAVGIEPTTY